tara:strand:- start:479 stop:580 length:102 start_codon:yes stop_codon:yes gene_type:complete
VLDGIFNQNKRLEVAYKAKVKHVEDKENKFKIE